MTSKVPGRLWAYGIRKSKHGLVPFAVRVGENTNLGYVVERHDMLATPGSRKPFEAANKLFAERVKADPNYPFTDPPFIQLPKELEDKLAGTAIKPGTLCWHNDREGVHKALIVAVEGDTALALFMTSKAGWNLHARLATERERCLWLGHMNGKKTSHLAPVTRPLREFYSPQDSPLPQDEVQTYLNEFKAGWR